MLKLKEAQFKDIETEMLALIEKEDAEATLLASAPPEVLEARRHARDAAEKARASEGELSQLKIEHHGASERVQKMQRKLRAFRKKTRKELKKLRTKEASAINTMRNVSDMQEFAKKTAAQTSRILRRPLPKHLLFSKTLSETARHPGPRGLASDKNRAATTSRRPRGAAQGAP